MKPQAVICRFLTYWQIVKVYSVRYKDRLKTYDVRCYGLEGSNRRLEGNKNLMFSLTFPAKCKHFWRYLELLFFTNILHLSRSFWPWFLAISFMKLDMFKQKWLFWQFIRHLEHTFPLDPKKQIFLHDHKSRHINSECSEIIVTKTRKGSVMIYKVRLNYLVLPDEKRKLNNRDYYRTNLNPNPNPRGTK